MEQIQTPALIQSPLRQLMRLEFCPVEVVQETCSLIFHESDGDNVVQLDPRTWASLQAQFSSLPGGLHAALHP